VHDPRSYLPCAPQLSFKPTGPDTRGTSSWATFRDMRVMPWDAWATALPGRTDEPCAVSALLSDTEGATRARAAPSSRMRGNGHRRWGALHDGMVSRVGPSVMLICPYASQVSFASRHGDCLCHPRAARCLRLTGGCAHLSATTWEAPGTRAVQVAGACNTQVMPISRIALGVTTRWTTGARTQLHSAVA